MYNKINALLSNITEENIVECKSMLMSEDGQHAMLNERVFYDLYRFINIYELEKKAGNSTIFKNIKSLDDILFLSTELLFIAIRIQTEKYDDETIERFVEHHNSGVSLYAYLVYSQSLNTDNDRLIRNTAKVYASLDDKIDAIKLLTIGLAYYPQSYDIAFELVNMYLQLKMLDEAKSIIANSVLKENEEFKKVIGT